MAPHIIEVPIISANGGVESHAVKSPESVTNAVSIDKEPVTNWTAGFQLEDHPIDVSKKLKVAVIGSGLSGVNAGILLPIKVPGIDLTIIDKNADVGGTWFENNYPGVRCDIPAHVYQSTFEPNTQWTEEYAQGHEILAYWKSVACKYDVYKLLRLNTQVLSAEWDEKNAQWTLELRDLARETTSKESFDVVVNAIGRFNAWKLPDYPGIENFKGHLRHSSDWDASFNPAGKRVAVIGNGASGIQVVPNIQPTVKRLDHYARSPTWIAGSFAGEGEGRRLKPNYYAAEQLKNWESPDEYYKFRRDFEGKFYRNFDKIFRGSKGNIALREEFSKKMVERLKDKPELVDILQPDFSPNCRRLTPGPGYLEALTKENVSYITTPIAKFTQNGIVTTDGVEREVDAVICSTGANRDMLPPFPIKGTGGRTIQDAWSFSPYTYLGVAVPNFPNLLLIQGPNGTGHSGTVPNQVETQITYISRLLRKVRQEGIKTFVPSQAATDDFTAYSDAFFARTVWTEGCSSWANGGKPGGRIHGHWPGSASHCNFVRRSPRWEDWEWTYCSQSGNRFAYLGNGWTVKETIEGSDLTPYLKKPEDIDLRSYHEEWFNL